MQLAQATTRLVANGARPFRAHGTGARCAPAVVCTASRDAELKQMEEFRAGLAKNLESASTATAPPPPLPAPQSLEADARDLEEVPMDVYWDVVKEQSNGALLVMDFYTQWCGPCKLIKPTLCDWAEEWAGKVNFRKFEAKKENADVGRACAIKSVPTFVVYKDGEEVGRVTGKQEEKLRKLIMEHM